MPKAPLYIELLFGLQNVLVSAFFRATGFTRNIECSLIHIRCSKRSRRPTSRSLERDALVWSHVPISMLLVRVIRWNWTYDMELIGAWYTTLQFTIVSIGGSADNG